MKFLSVDKEKCTKCGACADVCPFLLIKIGEDGPQEGGYLNCIACGHCVAVCPTEALDNVNAPLSAQVPLGEYVPLNAQVAAVFLRSRRSIRIYKPEQVPREKLLQILNIARFASTGGNSQGLSYLVISDKEQLRQVSKATFDWIREGISKGSERARVDEGILRTVRETGNDLVLRDAPHLIVALCNKDSSRGMDNARFSLAYAELFAPTVGVGTSWAGMVQRCAFDGYAPLLKVLDLPHDKRVAGALMAGYPRHTYYRLVDRNPLDVLWR